MTVVARAHTTISIEDVDGSTIRAFLRGAISARALPEPAWGPIGREVFERTYARDAGGRLETWAETCRRVVNGSLSYVDRSLWFPDEDIELFRLLYTFAAVPAGRHLWVTGTSSSHMSHNCWASGYGASVSDHYRYLAARLFEGGGVGANYSADLMAHLPAVVGGVDLMVACRRDHIDVEDVRQAAGGALVVASSIEGATVITVEDTREGWVDAWAKVIDLAHQPGHHEVVVDVSSVRPHGAPLLTFGGRASGPAPLVASLRAIAGVLDAVRAEGVETGHPRRLSGLETMTIDHEIASAVVSGGARRSARMSMMHWSDPDILSFIRCKKDQLQHWSTNISVEIDGAFALAVEAGDRHAIRVLRDVAEGMALNGEPGIVDTDAHSRDEALPLRVVNPCAEVGLQFDPADGAGESCNLGSVDLSYFGQDHVGAKRAFELMARFLYRSTLNPHRDEPARRIELQNRRIGVGIMGLQGWSAAHGVPLSGIVDAPELHRELEAFRRAARRAADDLARALGTPRPVKVTAVAPTGTIAQLSGTTPGIHPVMARYFIRRVRYANSDPQLAELKDAGYRVVPDIYAAATSVVEFVVRDQILDRYPAELIEQADELSAAQFFGLIATVQRHFCSPGDGNAISATAQIAPDTAPDELIAAIRPHLGHLKGMTVFPKVSRELAPYEPLTECEYLERLAAGHLAAVGDSNDGECAGGACPIR